MDASDSSNISTSPSLGAWAVMGPDPKTVQPARWYHLQDGDERHGPISLAAIRELVAERVVTGQTLVWSDGMPDWTPARDVPALIPPEPLRQHLGWSTGSGGAERSTTW